MKKKIGKCKINIISSKTCEGVICLMCLLLVVKEKTLPTPAPYCYRLEGRKNDILLGSPQTIIFFDVN